jgi:hypothetical protein
VTTLYGIDALSRVASPTDPSVVFSYLIARTFDDKGNICVYDYATEDGTGVDRPRPTKPTAPTRSAVCSAT